MYRLCSFCGMADRIIASAVSKLPSVTKKTRRLAWFFIDNKYTKKKIDACGDLMPSAHSIHTQRPAPLLYYHPPRPLFLFFFHSLLGKLPFYTPVRLILKSTLSHFVSAYLPSFNWLKTARKARAQYFDVNLWTRWTVSVNQPPLLKFFAAGGFISFLLWIMALKSFQTRQNNFRIGHISERHSAHAKCVDEIVVCILAMLLLQHCWYPETPIEGLVIPSWLQPHKRQAEINVSRFYTFFVSAFVMSSEAREKKKMRIFSKRNV